MIIGIISIRSLGDSIIQRPFILKLSGFHIVNQIIVITTPSSEPIFCDISKVKVFVIPSHNYLFSFNSFFSTLKLIKYLITQKLDFIIDPIGDFREYTLGLFSFPKRIISIGWSKHHTFKKTIYPKLFIFKSFIIIPENLDSIYKVMEIFYNRFFYEINYFPCLDYKKSEMGKITNIAIFPFASQPSRIWPLINWVSLIKYLIRRGYKVSIYVESSALKDNLIDIFEKCDFRESAINVVPLKDLLHYFTKKTLIISMDSFPVHLAHHLSLPSIMISGSNDPKIWAPPTSIVLSTSGGCIKYPCLNRPSCIGSQEEYSCIKSISFANIVNAVFLLEHKNTTS